MASASKTSEPRYHINIFWSEEDGCWLADVPDLQGCRTHGDTPPEALENVWEAMHGWLETAAANEMTIPEPHYSPTLYALPAAA